jgi:hypothetical protein
MGAPIACIGSGTGLGECYLTAPRGSEVYDAFPTGMYFFNYLNYSLDYSNYCSMLHVLHTVSKQPCHFRINCVVVRTCAHNVQGPLYVVMCAQEQRCHVCLHLKQCCLVCTQSTILTALRFAATAATASQTTAQTCNLNKLLLLYCTTTHINYAYYALLPTCTNYACLQREDMLS